MKNYFKKLSATLVVGAFAAMPMNADTSILKESDGWTKITTIPENVGDYYYAIVDNTNDLMLTMAWGNNQGKDYRTMYYRTSVNPALDWSAAWGIESMASVSGYETCYTIRNAEYTSWAFQTEWDAPHHYRTHDQANPCQWTAMILAYADGCWTFKNGKYPDKGYLGRWYEDDLAHGDEVAANKGGDYIGKFQIYSIVKAGLAKLRVNDLIAKCTAISTNSTPNADSDLTTFNTAISDATSQMDTATTVDALNTIYTNLEKARQAYVVKAIPAENTTFDYTFLVQNPTFDDGVNGWTNAAKATNKGGAITPAYGERWALASYVEAIEQSITGLPIGAYIVKAAAFRQDLIADATDQDAVYVFANEKETLVTDATPAIYPVNDILVYDGKITLGVKSKVATYKWMGIDNVTLLYSGKNLAFCKEALQQAIAKAEAVDENTLNNAVKAILTQAITDANTAKNDANATIVSVEKATSDLNEKVDFANEMAEAYAEVKAFISICENCAEKSTPATDGDRTTFNNAIELASDEKETAETVEALNDVYNVLENARQTYVLKAYPTDGNSFDMTFKIKNAEVASIDGWTTNAGLASNVEYNGAPDVFALDKWHWGAMAVHANQTISNLPDGAYTLTAMARTNGENMCYVYATSGDVEYKEVVVGGGETGNPWGLVSVSNILVSNGSPMTIGLKGEINNTWFSVDNFTLTLLRDLTDAEKLAAAKTVLKKTIESVTSLNTTKNVGDGLFKIPASAVTELEDAVSTAQGVYGNESATTADLEKANTDLLAAIDAYKNVELNGPSVDERFYITIATPGHGRLNYPVIAELGSAGTNNPTGYTFYAAGSFENYRPTVFTLTKVDGNLYNISVELEEGTVYLTYGSLNGSPADWNKSQIQGTTNVNAKGTFKIEASSVVDGGIRIVNTETGNYLDCENNATKNYPIYSGSHNTYEFSLVDASEVTTSIVIDANVQLATCVLLFDAELPANLKAYTTGTLENGCLNLVEVDELEAYKPYILYAENGYEGELSGKVDLTGYQLKVTDNNGLLAGAVETQVITYGYALQNQTGENGKGVAFYSVDTENSQEVTIPAGKCWLDVQKNSTPAATTRSISLRFPEGGATGIGDVKVELPADGSAPIYTIDGKRVDVMQSGQIYIIGGKKVIKK